MMYMKKSIVIILCISIFTFLSSCSHEKKWTLLLDKDLSQWNTYLSYRHSPEYKGEIPLNEKGEMIQSVGYNKDQNKVFSVLQQDGETVLRVSGEIYGCVFTKQEFENYHLKLKVKWGKIKWEPRTHKLRDSGICYHSVGECGKDFWRAWMLSQEFQVMEGHMGDYWNIATSAIDIKALIPEGTMNAVACNNQPFLAMGEGTELPGFCLRTFDNESPEGQWTELELICFEGKSLHIVNGKVVMVLQNSRYFENGKNVPLTRGKIQLQSEAAEVFYKDIKIRSITELPESYAAYFK